MLNKDKMTIHQCEKCGYETPYTTNLKQHLRRKTPCDKAKNSPSQTPSQTPSKSLTTKNSPRISSSQNPHNPHKGVKSQKKWCCESCCKYFSRSDSLRRHRREYCPHRGEIVECNKKVGKEM